MVPVPHTACVFELRGHVGSPAPSGLSPVRTGQELTSGEKRGRPSSVTPVRSPCFPGGPPEILLPGMCPGPASDVIRSNSHSFPSILLAAHPSSQVLGYTVQAETSWTSASWLQVLRAGPWVSPQVSLDWSAVCHCVRCWGEVGTPQEAPGEEDVSMAPLKAAPCLLLQGLVRSQLVSGRMGRPWAGELLTGGGCACAPVPPGRH